jgi:hypothetical protein
MKIVRPLALALFGIVAPVQAKYDSFKTIEIQELQSPPGERHSNAIINTPGMKEVEGIPKLQDDKAEGLSTGLVWFANDLVVPGTGGFEGGEPMGTQTGHCVEVWVGKELACYFNFNLDAAEGKGSITAEALFDLVEFPNAKLTITGGTGDFTGIVGSGYTSAPENFDGTTFFYTFDYVLLGPPSLRGSPKPSD